MKVLDFFEQLTTPEVNGKDKTRKEMLMTIGDYTRKFALTSIPLSFLAAIPKMSSAQSSGVTPLQVLEFALTLEYLESSFYNQGFSVNSNLIPSTDTQIFSQIRDHENEHVAYLQSAIHSLTGTAAPSSPTFDFAGNQHGASNNFTPFTDYAQFLALSQAFEDTGVRAYKGQAGNLQSSKDLLQAALQIHSVEARHASEVRRLRGNKGWITNASYDSLPPVTAAVYAGEDNITQGGVNVSTLSNANYGVGAATEAFDEPLTMDQVNAIANMFIM